MFNPKLKKFLAENPEQTILGFAWSCYWRLYLVIFGIVVAICLFSALLD